MAFDEEEIYIDRLRQVIKRIEQNIANELRTKPYVVVPIRSIRKELGNVRGIGFIIRVLSRRYYVERDGNWLIVQPKREKSRDYAIL